MDITRFVTKPFMYIFSQNFTPSKPTGHNKGKGSQLRSKSEEHSRTYDNSTTAWNTKRFTHRIVEMELIMIRAVLMKIIMIRGLHHNRQNLQMFVIMNTMEIHATHVHVPCSYIL